MSDLYRSGPGQSGTVMEALYCWCDTQFPGATVVLGWWATVGHWWQWAGGRTVVIAGSGQLGQMAGHGMVNKVVEVDRDITKYVKMLIKTLS